MNIQIVKNCDVHWLYVITVPKYFNYYDIRNQYPISYLPSLYNPLLYTWSLSLEEQYYLAYPLLHHYIRRLPIPALPSLAVVTLVSIAIGTLLHHTRPTFAFFLLPARIPHFLVDASAAIPERRVPSRKPSRIQRFISQALFLQSNASPLLLVPLLLLAGVLLLSHHSYVAVLLSHPFPVLMDRMSYAIYLVHWPVIVYLRCLFEGLMLSAPSITAMATNHHVCTVIYRTL